MARRILFTGASSFTGCWFVKELVAAGHDVTAIFRKDRASYGSIRGKRVEALASLTTCIWDTSFGSDGFVRLIKDHKFDLVCHHAAEVANYRSWDFDPLAAATANTLNCRPVLAALAEAGCHHVCVTGSVFEPYEGIGDAGSRAFNPYGLSKHISFELVRMEAERLGLVLGKFVIPNPFGPLEEGRFTSYLANEWLAGRTPSVATPDYIRDNIHVSLLALSYGHFCEVLWAQDRGVHRANPSGYIESQGAFARRFAFEMGQRLGKSLPLALRTQTEFPEPMIRVNSDGVARKFTGWSESRAWDQIVEYYARTGQVPLPE